MALLDEVVVFLDQELNTASIEDYPGAMNGLQLTNGGEIGRIVAAVDASLPVIEEAAEGGPGLLIVHHGMFWQGMQPVTGAFYRKLKIALDAGLAIYSSHLPLDVHPNFGNNRLLCNAIGLEDPIPFFEHKGQLMGLRSTWKASLQTLVEALETAVSGPVHVCTAGPSENLRVGVITGGAGGEVMKAFACGIDTFVTGEGPHWSYTLAEELNINVLYGGHYATETLGVREIALAVAKRFDLPWKFINHPSGL
jgi:dinuclear metal center YbgI/SA1388 family protein